VFGMDVIREIAKVPTDMHDCGELADDKEDSDSVSETRKEREAEKLDK
jgi:hypothetical protein